MLASNNQHLLFVKTNMAGFEITKASDPKG